MTYEQKQLTREKIIRILIDRGLAYAAGDPLEKTAADDIVQLIDRMLYNASGKKIDYDVYCDIYNTFNGPWYPAWMYTKRTYREMAEKHNISVSQVNAIAKGKYWQ